MDTLRDEVIKLAQANPELRVHLLPIIKEAKAGKKLKGKKLRDHINNTYRRLGDRITINMMDIPKIWNASQSAYESGETAEEADSLMEEAMKKAIQKAKVASTTKVNAALSIQGEVPAKYQKLTEDFAKKFHHEVDGIHGTSKEVVSNFVGNVLDAQKLAAWLKKYKVKGLHNNGRGFTVIWLK